MADNRILEVDFKHARASELFARVCSENKATADCDEYKAILTPVDGMNLVSNDLALSYMVAERVDILLVTILIQFELAAKGSERVKRIEANKDALLSTFNSDELEIGLKLDVGQQSCDMAIMTTMSHSALMFAEQYSKQQSDRLEPYRDMVFDMLQLYKHNNDHFNIKAGRTDSYMSGIESYELPEQNLSSYIVSDPVEAYLKDTREVYELNVMMAQICEHRFENGVRSLYYWREALGGGLPRTEATGSEIYDKFCAPKHDWEYEMEIQDVISQRIDILSDRSQAIGRLIDNIQPHVN